MAQSASPEMYMNVASEFAIRFTASDAGRLRVLLAAEGAACRVGDVVALLSTEDEEPVDETAEALQAASEFRVVPNPIIPLF